VELHRRSRSLEDRYRQLLETQDILSRVAREMGPATDLHHVLQTVLGAMRALVQFRGGTICLVEGDLIRIAASDPAVSPDVAQLRLPIGSGLAGRTIARGETVYSPDLDKDERVDPVVRNLGSNAAMRSYLAVPLVCLGQVTGLLQVDALEPDAFAEEDRVLLEGLASQVAGMIESARRYEEIMELERLKSDFVARVSHELRTPLTIMSGFISTLLSHGQDLDEPTREQMLQRIDVATARLSGLIEELLLISRLEAGVVVAQPEPVDVCYVLEHVRREAAHTDRVTIDCPAGLVVDTDPALLRRAVGMLVDNALKYAGGALLRVTENQLEIIDEGPGIPPDVRDTVFELFTRGSEVTTIPGMGIGLPVARTLLASLGADLRIEPGEVRGTRVVVTFRPTTTGSPPIAQRAENPVG